MSKGQVIIPSEGVAKRPKLSDFYGSLRAQRPFPGKRAVREEVGQALFRTLS